MGQIGAIIPGWLADTDGGWAKRGVPHTVMWTPPRAGTWVQRIPRAENSSPTLNAANSASTIGEPSGLKAGRDGWEGDGGGGQDDQFLENGGGAYWFCVFLLYVYYYVFIRKPVHPTPTPPPPVRSIIPWLPACRPEKNRENPEKTTTGTVFSTFISTVGVGSDSQLWDSGKGAHSGGGDVGQCGVVDQLVKQCGV